MLCVIKMCTVVYAFLYYYDLISLNPAVVRMRAKYGIAIADSTVFFGALRKLYHLVLFKYELFPAFVSV